MRERARFLRKNMTDAEHCLWHRIRQKQLGVRFRRQAPIGRYIVDFVSFERRLIIEVDGGQHAEQLQRDGARTRWLESQGFVVLRFWNNQVIHETDAVLEQILAALCPPP